MAPRWPWNLSGRECGYAWFPNSGGVPIAFCEVEAIGAGSAGPRFLHPPELMNSLPMNSRSSARLDRLVLSLVCLLLSACKVYTDRGQEVLAPSSAVQPPPAAAALDAIDRSLRADGYRPSPRTATESFAVGKESVSFKALRRYRRGGAGEFRTYAGPNGLIAYECEFHFIPPFQFPPAEYNEARLHLRMSEELKKLGYHWVVPVLSGGR